MIDKRLLNDSVRIKLKNEEDEWGKIIYSEEFEVKPVRFDRNVNLKNTTGTKNTTVNKPGVIFIYPKFANIEVNDSWLEAQVIDEYSTYTVIAYSVNKLGNKIFSYEVEVI